MKTRDLEQRLSQLEAHFGSARLQPPGPEATDEERCAYVVRASAHQRGQPMSEAKAHHKAGLVLGFIQAAEQMREQPEHG